MRQPHPQAYDRNLFTRTLILSLADMFSPPCFFFSREGVLYTRRRVYICYSKTDHALTQSKKAISTSDASKYKSKCQRTTRSVYTLVLIAQGRTCSAEIPPPKRWQPSHHRTPSLSILARVYLNIKFFLYYYCLISKFICLENYRFQTIQFLYVLYKSVISTYVSNTKVHPGSL